jgi:tRNA(adenine34) deaminase
MNHASYMKAAVEEAEKARRIDEVPIGAVLVDAGGDLIAAGHNQTITQQDPTAHAEMLVLRRAAERLKNYRLPGTTLYVTVEPCLMCMGAIVHARVGRLVFGAPDSKWGAAGSLYDFSTDSRLNHAIEVIAGIETDACRNLIQDFFRGKRKSIAS